MDDRDHKTMEEGRGVGALVNGASAGWGENNGDHEFLDAEQTCRLLGIHRNTLYRLIQTGDLPALRYTAGGRWRFRRRDLLDWVEARRAGRFG